MATLRGLGRDRRRSARQSAVTGLYSPEAPRLRRTSRDTTEGSRPIERAICLIPRRAFNPVAISTRSENDKPSTVDLRSIGRAVADLVEADVWRIDRVTTGAEVAAVWLGRGDDPTGAAVAVQRTVACLSMTGRLVEEGPVAIPDQLLLIYVLQAATETDARTIVAAAGPGSRGGFAALSVRRGTLVVIMIARSVRAGVAPYEHGRSLERFAGGLSSIMSDRPTS
jgi:hypothetical protein